MKFYASLDEALLMLYALRMVRCRKWVDQEEFDTIDAMIKRIEDCIRLQYKENINNL